MLSIIAAKHGHSDFVIIVLLTGTAPNVQDEDGVTAIHGAAFTPANNTQIVELLLDANANVHGGPFGSTLQAAALSGKAKPILVSLKRGVLPDYTEDSYGTSFQIAQKRLEDLERELYNRKRNGYLRDCGPDGFLDGTPKTASVGREKRPANRVGDEYVPHLDFSRLPYADYQAIIDVPQSRNAL